MFILLLVDSSRPLLVLVANYEVNSACPPEGSRVRRRGESVSVRLASWNVGSLSGKSIELVKVLHRRRISIACIQETKWVGAKAKEIDGFKLWYSGVKRTTNGVGILVRSDLVEQVVEVRRKSDRIMSIKLVVGAEVLNVVSVYAPQMGLDEECKRLFWEDLDEVVQSFPRDEGLLIGGDFNGHIGRSGEGYESVHGGLGYGVRNSGGVSILDFAVAYDLSIVNSYFRKREEHLVTFKNGSNRTQIDYFLMRASSKRWCRDCKVLPNEGLTTQHRLLVLDVEFRDAIRRKRNGGCYKVRWWNLKGANVGKLAEKIKSEGDWKSDGDSSKIWEGMADCIRRSAREVLGVSREGSGKREGAWWWSEEVRGKVEAKQEKFKALMESRTEEEVEVSKVQYKIAKKEAKKAVAVAKNKAYERLYQRLNDKSGENEVFKLARARERRTRDLGSIRCIKGEDGKVLVEDARIQERWQSYFCKLFNGEVSNVSRRTELLEREEQHNYSPERPITREEVKEALRKMKSGKAVGPDGIPVEVWKSLGEDGVTWLTVFFNVILRTARMPEEWRHSTIIPLYKNKGDAQNCNNYRGIKLLSHTMKLWERVIESRLRATIGISDNQFGFRPGRSTMEAIHLLRSLIGCYRDRKRDLHMVFIDLEKAYDRVPRDVLWRCLERRGVPVEYMRVIRDMYEGVRTRVRTGIGDTEDFSIDIGLHQGSALSPFLFITVMDELTRGIQDEIPWCMLFADDIVLIDESREGVNNKLERWRATLEAQGFRLSRSKTEYLHCSFSAEVGGAVNEVAIEGESIPKVDKFRYLGSIIQENGDIEEDINHRIRVGWQKWKNASGVLCDKRIPLRLKGRVYRMVVRPALLYGAECWPIRKSHVQRMRVTEMRMIRWICGHTKLDKIRNEVIRGKLGVASIEDKLREARLRWFGHIKRRPRDAPVRRCETIECLSYKRCRGRPKKSWSEVIRHDLRSLGLVEDMAQDRKLWKARIRAKDF